MAEIDLKRLFPEPLCKPVTVREAWRLLPGIDKSKLQLTPLYYQYWKDAGQGGSVGKIHAIKRLRIDRPAFTITKSEGNGGLYHPTEPRMLALIEFKRIASYPDLFIFPDNRKGWQERIGNSVPPLFMRAIAQQIKYVLWNGMQIKPSIKSRIDYKAILDEAWQQHLAPKPDDAPTVISLFAGGGGSSLGYSMAGYRELLAVEWDNNAVETFRLNFPDVPVYHGDIAKLSVDECLKMTGLQPGELDLLDGSPPCQGFSTAGKRILDDPRNQLFKEYVRLLRGLKPKVFVMENVSGMVKGKMKLVFAEIMKELKASGYRVSARLMNAKYFYVPQSRERLIFIGVREDLEIEPGHPGGNKKVVPVKECYKRAGEVLTGIELLRWQHIPPGGNFQNLPPELRNGQAKYSNFHRRLHPNRPAFTLGRTGNFSSGRFYHWSEPRRVGDIELARIGSYPDGYQFIGNGKDIHYRIGNSVPPLFMREIALHIKANIFNKQPELIV